MPLLSKIHFFLIGVYKRANPVTRLYINRILIDKFNKK